VVTRLEVHKHIITGILPLGDEAFHQKYQAVDAKFDF